MDYLAACLGLLGCYLVGTHKYIGWLLYASASSINAYLGYKSGLIGMALGGVFYAILELRGYYLHKIKHKEDS